jgi:hypothetical protein
MHWMPLSPDPSHPTPVESVLAPRVTGHRTDDETSEDTSEEEEEEEGRSGSEDLDEQP